ncbi:MAG: ribosome recycling factor [Candidatus Nealsonbacteria bacterium CG_4_9_14_0_2_um_filter_37_38]|uniref:Ribosome recycling factor n=1 Tax=Candidatus Nealsonbacteria bacterium CG_4_10_14_0_8_um_filter_37_14 TaxID=1974684 RepID=A0A2M7R5Q9_9BACT|nr:MAG: ribosome recycling factor [Candidatus Nealsonbacteria bacterium CG11_big_fil_rev_8_21_14_0_20_37_68]PIW92101.1 MAG: ribosome recycling factor [Candidatus Nealsonbacteria bacterium CG_4_8_14_3_um_filter_37_23]PIY88755.1 MAG: ribosome recycling factor [Candidatus Nealsonbacteria bacterium CG_4_10_14_0_8_um_filter_37_14]PJC51374.1 MAG: ribosome recycling factor [Candidatus Nealsonbacteria bacterium CG_4_9_14_0_2_um_filter_37_38]
MEYKEIIDRIKPELDKVINFLEREVAKIRSGRASASLVEDVPVECFGQKLPLKQWGVITLSGPRQILIQPWDKSYLESIEKAIRQFGGGLSPVVDKDVIRVNLPPLTEEFRKELLRVLSEKQEEARKTVRKWREEAWDEIQEKFKEGEIREDDKFRAKDELQDLVDDRSQKIAQIGEKKKKEIME